MATNLGRDKVWTPEIWTEIDNAVKEEWKQRVAQTIIRTIPMEGAADVSAPRIDLNTGTIAEAQKLPFVEISREFSLTQSQVDNEATLRNGRDFARVAARLVAMAEDAVVFQGGPGFNALVQRVQGQQPQQPPLLRATNLASVANGLLGIAPVAVPVNQMPAQPANPVPAGAGGRGGAAAPAAAAAPAPEPTYRENTVTAVLRGMAALRQAGQPGPYALFLSPRAYADAGSPIADQQTPAERLERILKGGFQSANELPDNRGLLVSLGGEPVTICLAQDIAVAFNQQDPEGNYRFRAFERVQVVVREPSALVRLEFQ
jgi:uncharacterized linocin/CFP29 family protein